MCKYTNSEWGKDPQPTELTYTVRIQSSILCKHNRKPYYNTTGQLCVCVCFKSVYWIYAGLKCVNGKEKRKWMILKCLTLPTINKASTITSDGIVRRFVLTKAALYGTATAT